MKQYVVRFLEYFLGTSALLLFGLVAVIGALPTLRITAVEESGIPGGVVFLIVLLLSLLVGLCVAVVRLGVEPTKGPPVEEGTSLSSQTADAVISMLRKDFDEGSYQHVVLFGRNLIRPLWVDWNYDARIEIGKLVDQAAQAIGDDSSRALALVDPLGWTYVAKGVYAKAEENIRKGLKIAQAQKKPDFYLIAKALRHLGGIESRRGNFSKANDFLKTAETQARKIGGERDREEMLAGIWYGRAELQYLMHQAGKGGDLDEAEKLCYEARQVYDRIADRERQVKIFSLLSNIYLKKDMLDKAGEMALKGLEVSQRATRKDEIVKNLLSIGKNHLKRGEAADARAYLKRAYDEAKSIGLEQEKREAEELLSHLGEE